MNRIKQKACRRRGRSVTDSRPLRNMTWQQISYFCPLDFGSCPVQVKDCYLPVAVIRNLVIPCFPPGVFELRFPASVYSFIVLCFVRVYDPSYVYFVSCLPISVPGCGSIFQSSSHRGVDSWAAPAAWQQLPTKRGSTKASPQVPLNGFKPQGGGWGWPVASTGGGGPCFLSSCTYLSCDKISWSFFFFFSFPNVGIAATPEDRSVQRTRTSCTAQ